jgi:hypothetical protein
MDWKAMGVTFAKKVAVLAAIALVFVLINPLVEWLPYGPWIHAAIALYFVYNIYGKVI